MLRVYFIVISLIILIGFNGCKENKTPTKPHAVLKNELDISIIHINDTHSHLASEIYGLYFDGVKTYTQIGGASRVAAKIKTLQNDSKNTLTLNAGDTFQGTFYFTYFNGKAEAAMLNTINWDAISIGNHEFDNGDDFLSTYLDMLNTSNQKILSANVQAPKDDALFNKWSPYTIKEFENGERVGIIGIDIVSKTKNSSNPSKKIIFHDEVKTAQKYIDKLNDMGINKIVLLTHVGLDNDKKYASKLRGVDIMVGGDSHSLMGDFSSLGLTSDDKIYPYETTDADGKKVCIVQAWSYNYAVGNLKVHFDKNGDVSSCLGEATVLIGDSFKQLNKNGEKVDVNNTRRNAIKEIINSHDNIEIVHEDAQTLNTFSYYSNQIQAKEQVIIGNSSEHLGYIRIPKNSASGLMLANQIAPVVCKAFYEISDRADACIQNAGGVRMPLKKGNITFGDAYALLPYSNTLFELDMLGSQIHGALEDAVDEAIDGGSDGEISTGAFPYAYALRYDVDSSAKKGNRILNLEIKDKTTGIYSLIDTAKNYVIVTNSYVANGKDGYDTFKKIQQEKGKSVNTYLDYAMSFVKYVKRATKKGESISKLPLQEYPIKSYK